MSPILLQQSIDRGTLGKCSVALVEWPAIVLACAHRVQDPEKGLIRALDLRLIGAHLSQCLQYHESQRSTLAVALG